MGTPPYLCLPSHSMSYEREFPNYRQQIRKALPAEYFKPDPKQYLWFLFHFSVIGACLFALSQHFNPWVAPLLVLILGHSYGCLGFLGHDVLHGGTIKNLFWRDLLGGIAFSPFFISPKLWRRWHNADHHTHTQVRGVDPDHLFTIDDYKNNPVLKFLYRLSPLARNLVIFSSFTYRMTQQQLRMVILYTLSSKVPTVEKVIIWTQLLVQCGAWVGLTYAVGGWPMVLWGYGLPMLVANTMVISYIATNHFLNPLGDERDVLATSLTVTLPKWLSWLDPFHAHFGAHVAHHLFPQSAAKHSRAIEAKAEELFPDRYHSLPLFTALKMLWNTPWIYEDDKTLIDPQRNLRTPTLGSGLEDEIPEHNKHHQKSRATLR